MQRIGHDSTAAAICYQRASCEADEAIAAAIEDVSKAAKDGDDGAAGALVPPEPNGHVQAADDLTERRASRCAAMKWESG